MIGISRKTARGAMLGVCLAFGTTSFAVAGSAGGSSAPPSSGEANSERFELPSINVVVLVSSDAEADRNDYGWIGDILGDYEERGGADAVGSFETKLPGSADPFKTYVVGFDFGRMAEVERSTAFVKISNLLASGGRKVEVRNFEERPTTPSKAVAQVLAETATKSFGSATRESPTMKKAREECGTACAGSERLRSETADPAELQARISSIQLAIIEAMRAQMERSGSEGSSSSYDYEACGTACGGRSDVQIEENVGAVLQASIEAMHLAIVEAMRLGAGRIG